MNDKEFWEWYQDPMTNMYYETWSLPRLFVQFDIIFGENKENTQNALDFAYRLAKCSLAKIDLVEEKRTLLAIRELGKSISSDIDSHIIWETCQFHLLEKGRALLDECNLKGRPKETSPLFKAKLTAVFDEYNVGFDKKAFVPIHYQKLDDRR
ncbi:hypothetical protein GT348_08395 [Aristophania vespae]|uniref:Uncharacterized protein n=1 Tax=Aristophania vespae TaxID=2697033 RepID=A0A6P1NI78_9PROT|nr:hypothetical protein [Aristophania vespae]QHI96240.1 hypothetical protein GT348_08395 [Aristophania vespae]